MSLKRFVSYLAVAAAGAAAGYYARQVADTYDTMTKRLADDSAPL